MEQNQALDGAKAAISEVAAEWVPIASLRAWDRNPRRNDAAVQAVAASIERFGFAAPIVARRADGEVIAGHTRLKAAALLGLERVPVRFVDLDPADAHLLALADNRLGEIAEWDAPSLQGILDSYAVTDQQIAGWSSEDVATLARDALAAIDLPSPGRATGILAARFLVAPFSVLNAREGWWQERKRLWIGLGIRSELGRVSELLGTSPSRNDPQFYAKKREVEQRLGRELTWEEFVREHHGTTAAQHVNGVLMKSDSGNDPLYYYKKQEAEARLGRALSTEEFQREHYAGPESYESGSSIFDPVLCELAYRWFTPPGGVVLDPFAGGSVRGVVAGVLGRSYIGIELREDQTLENERQALAICGAPDRAPARAQAAAPARAQAEEVVLDAEALTPVQRVGDVWIKRDDLFEFAGARGSKARAGRAIGMTARGLSVAGSRSAPMISRVARIGEALGIPVRCHVAPSNELSDQEKDAVAHGAELVKHKVGYLRTLVAKSRADAAEREGWRHIELGLESEEYVEVNSRQAANIPREASRVVVCVGSGNGLACVLHGLRRAGIAVPVLGVRVGLDPVKLLDRVAPEGWRDSVDLVTSAVGFEERAPSTSIGGVELDPYYEAKCIPFLRPGDCLYVLARRTVDDGSDPAAPAAPAAPPVEVEPMADWQKGISIEALREVAALFKQHDKRFALGAFSGFKETDAAIAWSDGSLRLLRAPTGELVGAAVVKVAKVATEVRDFTGDARARIERGAFHVKRIACAPGREASLAAALRALGPCWVECWQESETDRSIVAALGGVLQAVKIRASSEQVGVYRCGSGEAPGGVSAVDSLSLCRLDLPTFNTAPLLAAIERAAPEWADHYSTYNKRHSWSALALRGYGGRTDFIEKPDEMAKRWKIDNAEKLAWQLEDTPLRALLPEAEEIVAAIPGVKHRVRLMRLAAQNGELTRHADITDRLAGTAEGKLLRIHVPLVTNDRVLFQGWTLDGSMVEAHMVQGSTWYLDTRKGHTARNGGDCDRIHLVVDVESNPALLGLLRDPAPVVSRVEVRPLSEDESCGAFATPEIAPARETVAAMGEAARPIAPRWIVGDSREIATLLPEGDRVDFVFSCPPYFDLEVYSDDARDLSTMSYPDFLAGYRAAIAGACARLRDDRFACFVVGDIRDRRGNYRNFVADTIQAFRACGLELYNEAILVTAAGSLPIRAGKIFSASRKLGKTHQNILVFVKGDGGRAAQACGPVDVDEATLAAAAGGPAVDSGFLQE